MKGSRPTARRLLGVISPVAKALGRSIVGKWTSRKMQEWAGILVSLVDHFGAANLPMRIRRPSINRAAVMGPKRGR